VLGLMLFNIAVTILGLRQPGEGCLVSQPGGLSQIIHVCYSERPTPLRPGDELLAAGGVSLIGEEGFWVRDQLPEGWGAGATIAFVVKRGGETLTLPVPIDPLPWAGVTQHFIFAATTEAGSYVLYLGFLAIFLLAPQSVAARALFVSFGAHFAVTKVGWAGGAVLGKTFFLPWWLSTATLFLNSFWIWVFWPSLLLLLISFPRRVWPASRWPRATAVLIYAVPVATVLFTLITRSPILYRAVLSSQLALTVVAFVAVPIHTFLRVRDRTVRAQSGWLLLSLGVYLVPLAIFFTLENVKPGSFAQFNNFFLTPALSALFTLLTPLSLGIAILRHRLFDIDIIIRRTLLYSVLTLALGATYFLGVVALQWLFVRLTGQANTLAIVASTLVIAVLFRPLRRLVQAFIDRRFFRRKYNAQLVLAQFALRAQQAAELDALSADILGVVQETLEPEGVRLWLANK